MNKTPGLVQKIEATHCQIMQTDVPLWENDPFGVKHFPYKNKKFASAEELKAAIGTYDKIPTAEEKREKIHVHLRELKKKEDEER